MTFHMSRFHDIMLKIHDVTERHAAKPLEDGLRPLEGGQGGSKGVFSTSQGLTPLKGS